MTKRQKNIWGFTVLFLLIAVGMGMGYLEVNSRRSHSAPTTGHIYDVTGLSKSSQVWVRYKYKVGQKVYDGLSSLQSTSEADHLRPLSMFLINMRFPVIYDSTDLKNSEILVSSEQYERYKLEPPDSLSETISTYESILKKN